MKAHLLFLDDKHISSTPLWSTTSPAAYLDRLFVILAGSISERRKWHNDDTGNNYDNDDAEIKKRKIKYEWSIYIYILYHKIRNDESQKMNTEFLSEAFLNHSS